MKLAAITIFCKERFRIENWVRFYNEYKSVISIHYIVNNGDEEDTDYLKKVFPNSIVLYCEGGNMAKSYNMALTEIYKNPEIDAIMHITNDIKISSEDVRILYDSLFFYDDLAVIGPAVLKKDCNIVDGCGFMTTRKWGNAKPLFSGKSFDDIPHKFMYVTYVTGGINIIKRDCYEKMGMQDEAMNMYRDEWDLFARMLKLGYKEGVQTTAKCWHQHEYAPETLICRQGAVLYYVNRNTIYLDCKHANYFYAVCDAVRLGFKQLLFTAAHLSRGQLKKIKADMMAYKGLYYGLIKKMDNSI